MSLIANPPIVIAFTVLVNAVTRKIPFVSFSVPQSPITSVAWLLIAAKASIVMAVLSLELVVLGEITQSLRDYAYISRLAPPNVSGRTRGLPFYRSASGHWLADGPAVASCTVSAESRTSRRAFGR